MEPRCEIGCAIGHENHCLSTTARLSLDRKLAEKATPARDRSSDGDADLKSASFLSDCRTSPPTPVINAATGVPTVSRTPRDTARGSAGPRKTPSLDSGENGSWQGPAGAARRYVRARSNDSTRMTRKSASTATVTGVELLELRIGGRIFCELGVASSVLKSGSHLVDLGCELRVASSVLKSGSHLVDLRIARIGVASLSRRMNSSLGEVESNRIGVASSVLKSELGSHLQS